MKLRLETTREITTEIDGWTDFNSDDYTAFIGKTDDEIVNLISDMDLVTMMNLETKEVLETEDLYMERKRLKCLKDTMEYCSEDSDGSVEDLDDDYQIYYENKKFKEIENENWGVKILTDIEE